MVAPSVPVLPQPAPIELWEVIVLVVVGLALLDIGVRLLIDIRR